jgi:hypothetical protein
MSIVHPELHPLKSILRSIYESLSNFRPLAARPPILDSSTDAITGSLDSTDDGQWLQQENIPGLKQLRDSVKIDLDVLERVGLRIQADHFVSHLLIPLVVPG